MIAYSTAHFSRLKVCFANGRQFKQRQKSWNSIFQKKRLATADDARWRVISAHLQSPLRGPPTSTSWRCWLCFHRGLIVSHKLAVKVKSSTAQLSQPLVSLPLLHNRFCCCWLSCIWRAPKFKFIFHLLSPLALSLPTKKKFALLYRCCALLLEALLVSAADAVKNQIITAIHQNIFDWMPETFTFVQMH